MFTSNWLLSNNSEYFNLLISSDSLHSWCTIFSTYFEVYVAEMVSFQKVFRVLSIVFPLEKSFPVSRTTNFKWLTCLTYINFRTRSTLQLINTRFLFWSNVPLAFLVYLPKVLVVFNATLIYCFFFRNNGIFSLRLQKYVKVLNDLLLLLICGNTSINTFLNKYFCSIWSKGLFLYPLFKVIWSIIFNSSWSLVIIDLLK